MVTNTEELSVLFHQSPYIIHLFAVASHSWGRPPQGLMCSGSPWKSPKTAEPELQGSWYALSPSQCGRFFSHPDYGLTSIFSQTLSHWKARAELNGRTWMLFLWYCNSNNFPFFSIILCSLCVFIYHCFPFKCIQHFLELSRPSLISYQVILPYRLPCLIKDF